MRIQWPALILGHRANIRLQCPMALISVKLDISGPDIAWTGLIKYRPLAGHYLPATPESSYDAISGPALIKIADNVNPEKYWGNSTWRGSRDCQSTILENRYRHCYFFVSISISQLWRYDTEAYSQNAQERIASFGKVIWFEIKITRLIKFSRDPSIYNIGQRYYNAMLCIIMILNTQIQIFCFNYFAWYERLRWKRNFARTSGC